MKHTAARREDWILVVETNYLVAKLASDLVAAWGYTSQLVSSAGSAMEVVSTSRPALALVGLKLLDGSGGLLARQLGALGIPALIVTGSLRSEAFEDLGGLSLLTKPYRADELYDAMVGLTGGLLTRAQEKESRVPS